ncbi:MAG: hypothetical protein LBK42_04855 [Propionibacteriaceae bacterium]|jgi:hypothetical protein|nr:hypothetical protein [Propionibacteriaceae bacterium]
MTKRQTVSVCAAGALAAVMAVAATFAWFTAHDSVTNSLEIAQIADGSVSLVKDSPPPAEWLPGQEVPRQVAVANNGSGNVLARVSFEEVMTKLDAPAKANDAPLSGSQIPQFFQADRYLIDPYEDPKDLQIAYINSSGVENDGLPAGLSLKMHKVVISDQTSYTFVPLHALDGANAGKYQRVTADFGWQNGKLIVSNIKYWAFDGQATTQAAWAEFTQPMTGAAAAVRPLAEIGYPATDKDGQKITLNYTDKAALSQPANDQWYYNAGDGFFYYIGRVGPGLVTPQLLNSLSLDVTADSGYSGLRLDLIVNLEAIQNTKEAITADSGWGLKDTTLLTALEPHCD